MWQHSVVPPCGKGILHNVAALYFVYIVQLYKEDLGIYPTQNQVGNFDLKHTVHTFNDSYHHTSLGYISLLTNFSPLKILINY